MKITYSIFLLLFTINFCFAKVWQGAYLIHSQADADAFTSVCNCTAIEGNLTISGKDIIQVDSLYTLTSVSGSLEILYNEQLNNLEGLKYLLEIGGSLTIRKNVISTTNGFERLQNIGGELVIKNNVYLAQLNGFQKLERINNQLIISDNPILKQIDLFKELKYCRQIQLSRNNKVSTIKAIGNLTEVSEVSISEHNNLQLIGGFNNLTTLGQLKIFDNPSLHTINGFEQLKCLRFFQLENNTVLSRISAFEQLEEVNATCTIKLPNSILNEDHFPTLKKVWTLETNLYNFKNLENIHRLTLFENAIVQDSLVGFSSVKTIDNLSISGNDSLKYLAGFDALEEASSISISNNKNLVKIAGFEALKSVGSPSYGQWELFTIGNNPSLHTIAGFNQLKNISGGFDFRADKLTYLDAFEQLEKVIGNFLFNVSSVFLSENYFSSLKQVDGYFNCNVSNFRALESVHTLHIEQQVINSDTLKGYPVLKQAGLIYIEYNYGLKHINSFHNLEVASIQICRNSNLRSIEGFENLHTVPSTLKIGYNSSLEDISAFKKLYKVNRLGIYDNRKLSDIANFQKLSRVDSIYITNTNLKNLAVLNKVNKLEILKISGNNVIEDLPDFNNLQSAKKIEITNNINLQKIKGFENLNQAEHITITSNANLISIEGFNKLNNLSELTIENGNLRKLNAFAKVRVMNNLNLTANVQLRSVENFSNLSLINNQLVLLNNLQLNNCCLINCWIEQDVVDELNIEFNNNGLNCLDLPSVKMACKETNCQIHEESLSDLNTNNPVAKQLQFSFIILEDQQAVNYKIYNINKQLIRHGSVIGNKGFNSKTVDLPDTERGFYFLQIEDEDSKEVVKFLKL